MSKVHRNSFFQQQQQQKKLVYIIKMLQQNGYLQNSNIFMNKSIVEDFETSYKIMLIGDSGVGKTCLLVRFKDDTFLTCNFIATVGIDFKVY